MANARKVKSTNAKAGNVETKNVYVGAGDLGLSFIFPSLDPDFGGIARDWKEGHFGTIVGQGGSGKSILALQIVTALLKQADELDPMRNDPERSHAAFYFSLEAHPKELRRQVEQFSWGRKRYANKWETKTDKLRRSGENEYSNGLYLISIPPPAESLNALLLKIRQTIAGEFKRIKSPVAIIIDPIGAVEAEDDFGTNLIQLKELADMHRTFLFLLAEKYAFDKYTSIEHYSQSIIHLEHDPGQQQHRRLHVQKARGQTFRSGYHYFELQSSIGIRVFPSVDAQSADAHARLSKLQAEDPKAAGLETVAFFPDGKDSNFLGDERIEAGSAVFLMGPPGTFKEYVASEFAVAEKDGATMYVSFKADFDAIRKANKKAELIDSKGESDQPLNPTIYFYDARSPLLTPEEILFTVSNFIASPRKQRSSASQESKPVTFRRAVIWGLRRLYDFPNFKDNIVRFLEALVTMLKSRQITTLVVDWPDKTSASTVPIVDLCQYIFLTRVCHTAESLERRRASQVALLVELWADKPRQVALLRAQRTRRGVHHSQGVVFKQLKDAAGTIDHLTVEKTIADKTKDFEYLWVNAGMKWEEDLSLLS